jgi:subtilisin family serine protease
MSGDAMKRKFVWACVVAVIGAVLVLSHPINAPDSDKPTPTPGANQPQRSEGTTAASDDHATNPYATEIYPETAETTTNKLPIAFIEQPRPRAAQKIARRATIQEGPATYPVHVYQPFLTPNDTLPTQWWSTAVNAPAMWDIPLAANPVTLAIIDTGFALQHEEFTDRWHKNTGEIGATTQQAASQLNCTDRGLAISKSCNLVDDDSDGIVDNESGPTAYQNPSSLNCTAQNKTLDKSCNRIDDEDNGYIDDVTGWDFVNYDNSVQAGQLNPNGDGTTHGTMVAGVAAATGNNNKGIAGISWTAKILPIQALDDDSYGDTYTVGKSIRYAADQGSDVISLSLGSDTPDAYVRSAVQYAISKGSIVIAASGNDGCDCISYPANYPEVLAVGATDQSGQRASFSAYGSNLDIVAPGTNITTPAWSNTYQTNGYISGAAGTSFATPLVAGLVANLAAQQPTASQIQLTAALKENTHRLTMPTTPYRTNTLGFGQLDARKTLQRMTTPQIEEQSYQYVPASNGSSQRSRFLSEAGGLYYPKMCIGDSIPSTAVYEITGLGSGFLTMSEVEVAKATASGAAASLLFYGCVQQPHDTATIFRQLDVYKEFRNDHSDHLP